MGRLTQIVMPKDNKKYDITDAYDIKGRGVPELNLHKALKSDHFNKRMEKICKLVRKTGAKCQN